MTIDLSKLEYNDNEITIDETIELDKSYYENTEIRDLSNIKVIGSITKDNDETYQLIINIMGKMILPCSISLVDVEYPFDIKIEEIIDSTDVKNEDYVKIIDNTLDIMPIIWQNIVVEIPMRVISPNLSNVKLEGDGWKLLTEDEENDELDPRLDKLRDLLDD